MAISFGGGGRRGEGGGIKLRTPPDIFTAATRTGAESSRDRTLTADDLTEFNADPNLLIILRIAGSDTFQARRTGGWHDVTHIVEGARGPGPTDAQVTSAVQAGVKAYARTGGPDVPEGEIDPDIARDAEVVTILRTIFTTARQAKLAGIETGAQVNLAGAALQTAIDTATGGTISRSAHAVLRTAVQTRDLLDGLLGTGWRTGGGGSGITLDQAIDGVGAALAALPEFTYDAVANTFTFALANASVDEAALSNAVRLKLNADESAAVVSASVNTVIPDTANGDTYALTGSTARRFSLPAASGGSAVSDGWQIVTANRSSAVLTVAADGSDTIDGSPELSVPAGEAVRLQKVAAGAWITIADTQKGTVSGGDGSPGAARGTKLATSGDLESSGNRQLDTEINSVTWTKESGAPSLLSVDGSNPQRLAFAIGKPPADVIGLWFVSLINGAEVDQILHPWNSHISPDREGLRFTGTSRIVIREQEVNTSGFPTRYSIEGGGTPIPANATVEVFYAVDSRGGDPGDDGTHGSFERTIFRAAASAPATPTAPNSVTDDADPTLPTGWAATPPTGDTPIWASLQRVARGATAVTYTTPRRWDGADGGEAAANSITAAQARADTDEHKAEWRTRIGVSERAESEVRMRVNPPVEFALHIEQPANLFAGADTARFEAAGQPLGTATYRANTPRQVLSFTLSAAVAAAIDDNGDSGEGDFVEVDVYIQTGTSSSATPAYQRRLFIPAYGLLRKFAEKAATAGATRTWTYTLDAADTELWIGSKAGSGTAAWMSTVVPRALLGAVAEPIVLDHRNPGNNGKDGSSAGVDATISSNTLTLTTVGWINAPQPRVFSK